MKIAVLGKYITECTSTESTVFFPFNVKLLYFSTCLDNWFFAIHLISEYLNVCCLGHEEFIDIADVQRPCFVKCPTLTIPALKNL